jgi:hypothetical protein
MVAATLYLASKLIAKAISDLVLLARYISVPMSLRYEYSELNTSSPSWCGRNGPVSFFEPLTTKRVLDG